MATGNLSEYIIGQLVNNGYSQINLHRCYHEEDIISFSSALEYAVDNNRHGLYVDKHTPEELQKENVKVFLSQDEMAGVAVWPDRNICAVFRDERSKLPRASGELILTALSTGGNKLDCYDGFLSSLYAQFGFIPVARVKFNKDRAPEGWKFGEPDIIFWIHCGDTVKTVAQRLGKIERYPIYPTEYPPEYLMQMKRFDENGYEKAGEYRDKMMKDGKEIFHRLFPDWFAEE